ncbi:unnamed protein product [Prorocentrum cordatum]|uniref:Altered inheritance of mitochondria protein 24, mitochondrial n=1 Tax=Prorocentrum cordatum TaxID=2364126 RepID=A0ABN9WYH5_9DINO|nr:unnamed protein product [Polarella glacialis]
MTSTDSSSTTALVFSLLNVGQVCADFGTLDVTEETMCSGTALQSLGLEDKPFMSMSGLGFNGCVYSSQTDGIFWSESSGPFGGNPYLRFICIGQTTTSTTSTATTSSAATLTMTTESSTITSATSMTNTSRTLTSSSTSSSSGTVTSSSTSTTTTSVTSSSTAMLDIWVIAVDVTHDIQAGSSESRSPLLLFVIACGALCGLACPFSIIPLLSRRRPLSARCGAASRVGSIHSDVTSLATE